METEELCQIIENIERDINFLANENNNIIVYVGEELGKHVNLIFAEKVVDFIIKPELNDNQYSVITVE